MSECPNCHAEVGFSAFARLDRFWNMIKCPTCSSQLKLRGPLAWGTELVGLLICFAIYRMIGGNWADLLLTIPLGYAILFFQYRYVRLEAVEARER